MMDESAPLWTSTEIEAACQGQASSSFEALGVTFDSREVEPGSMRPVQRAIQGTRMPPS